MQTTPSNEQLGKLRDVVASYAPLCLYSFLVELEVINAGRKIGTYYTLDSVSGLPLHVWPEDIKKDYYSLCDTLPIDVLQRVFAEIHYFLIFSVAAQSSRYINIENQTRMLDTLFGIFDDKTVWGTGFPSEDAFTKYRKTDNPMLVFSFHLAASVGVRDAFDVARLTTSVGDIVRSFITPSVEKIFS
jgi:hypothetical protein